MKENIINAIPMPIVIPVGQDVPASGRDVSVVGVGAPAISGVWVGIGVLVIFGV